MGKERTFRHFLVVGSLIAEAALVPSKCTFLLAGILSLEQENILSPNLKHHDRKYLLFLFTVFDSFFSFSSNFDTLDLQLKSETKRVGGIIFNQYQMQK